MILLWVEHRNISFVSDYRWVKAYLLKRVDLLFTGSTYSRERDDGMMYMNYMNYQNV